VQLPRSTHPYLKVIGWGWFYLSTILDDFSRYIIAWKLCTTMKVEDVTATLDLALKASGLDQAKVIHRPRLLSDNVLRAEGDRIGGQSFSVREYALAA
jgi:putative transposase